MLLLNLCLSHGCVFYLSCICLRPRVLNIQTSIFLGPFQLHAISINKLISYLAYTQSFRKSFANIVPDISKFSTYSARSGRATLAPSSGVSERNLQHHGHLASAAVNNIDVMDSLASRLEVSKAL